MVTNMSNANPYQKYQEQSINTMTPVERIVLLFDKAVLNMTAAITYIENKDPCQAHNRIVKAEDIVLYLREILNMKYPISKILFDYYTYIHKQLVMANINKDKELLELIIGMMDEVKSAWSEVETLSRENSSSQGKAV